MLQIMAGVLRTWTQGLGTRIYLDPEGGWNDLNPTISQSHFNITKSSTERT